MALTDLTRISTSGIATGSTIDSPILRKDVSLRGSQVGVTSVLFDSSDDKLNLKNNVKLAFGIGTTSVNLFYKPDTRDFRHEFDGDGNYVLLTNNFDLKNEDGSKAAITANNPGGVPEVRLHHDGNERIRTTNEGAVVTGILTATSFSGPILGSPINNPSGISTFYDVRVSNNLTVEGTTTTLDTNLIGVDRVEVGANSNTLAGIAVTQSGSADLVRLYDGSSQVVTVDDTGNVGLATDTGNGLINTRHAGTNQQVLHVRADLGSSNGRSINLFTPDTDNTNAPFRFQTGNGFLFQCDAENVFTIHADRKIGINETDPDTKLHISHSSPTEDIIRLEATPVTAATGERSRIVFHVNQSNGQAAKLAHIASHTLSNWGGELAFNTKPANGTPNQILSETMRLHADGYVTKPRQPSFAAYRAQNDYTLNNSIFTFNATKHNVGGHFSTSTHRFTAPVDGRYLFNFWAIYVSNVTNAYYTIRINGSAGNGMYTHMTKQNSSWNHVSSSYIFDLNQNDYVDMFSNSNVGWHGNSWQLFCGQLLS